MPKPLTLEEKLAGLAGLQPGSPGSATRAATTDALRTATRDKSNVVVGKAAELIGRWELAELAPELATLFFRFMEQPTKADKGCRAKSAAAEALYRLNEPADEVFLAGIAHVQMEPVWGGQEDTAAGLRGSCAMGLVRMNHPRAMIALGDLLADKELPARAAAAGAIAYSENPAGLPLLRLRAKIGDVPEVLTECFAAMFKLDGAASLPFVAAFLSHTNDETSQAAAMALGASRRPEAAPLLQSAWEKTLDQERRKTALLALALLRQEPALAFLVGMVREGTSRAARDAAEALATYRHDAALTQRVLDAARERDERDLLRAVEEAFRDG